MKIKVGCAMGLQGCKIEDEIEVEDGATNKEIKAEVREWALEQFEWWYDPARSSERQEMKLIELRDSHCKPMYFSFWLNHRDGTQNPTFTQERQNARWFAASTVDEQIDKIRAVRPNADLHAVEAQ